MKRLVLGTVLIVAAFAAVLLLRTALHQPEAREAVTPVDVNVDETAIAQRLAEAIRFRTVSHQQRTSFQAEEFEGFIDWVAASYPEVMSAMTLERVADFTLLFRWEGSRRSLAPILLTAHYDIVPVLPGTEGLWKHGPFEGAVVDGVIWGRGALDDKSGVIAQLEAASHLLKGGFTPDRTVYFSFGHDEEVGGSGAAAVTALLKERGVQLAWSLDEGSFVLDGMLPGVSTPMATINVAEKGSVTLRIVAKAAGGHSSMPPRQTAVGILADAISALEANPVPGGLTGLSLSLFDTASREMPFFTRLPFANRWLFGSMIEEQLSASTFGNAMLRTTTAPTMLAASTKSNVLPIEAAATVNFRIHPRDSVQDVIDHVKRVVENDAVEVRVPEGAGRAASEVSSWDSEGFRHIGRAVREVYGDVVVAPGLMIAASDTRHYGQIADNAFRFNPMVVTPADLTGFHGTNEKISASNLANGTRTYIRILQSGTTE